MTEIPDTLNSFVFDWTIPETEEEAARAYDVALIRIKGMEAITNFDLAQYNVKAILESPMLPVGKGAAKLLKTPKYEMVRRTNATSGAQQQRSSTSTRRGCSVLERLELATRRSRTTRRNNDPNTKGSSSNSSSSHAQQMQEPDFSNMHHDCYGHQMHYNFLNPPKNLNPNLHQSPRSLLGPNFQTNPGSIYGSSGCGSNGIRLGNYENLTAAMVSSSSNSNTRIGPLIEKPQPNAQNGDSAEGSYDNNFELPNSWLETFLMN